MTFVPQSDDAAVTVNKKTLDLEAGTYEFKATFDYPQLEQLSASEVLNPESQDLITQEPSQTKSVSFLSYTDKLLAGAWRFLTYFGRDSMIATLLLQPVLSEDDGGAIEAVIGAVLERINKTDGVVCHEETIGDYATYQNLLLNISSTKPICSYIMIDSTYYLAPVMENYFLKTETGRSRRDAFFAQESTLNFGNKGLSYKELALRNAEDVMQNAAPFAESGGQTQANLVHLEEDQIVGEWRDSTYGIGGGRIPYDVNTALVPAALRSIAALSAEGFFPEYPDWETTAAEYAKVWEDETLSFFEVTVPESEAKSLVQDYTQEVGYGFPSHAGDITSDVVYHGLALNGYDNQALVKVMNTDDCFRLFMLNTTNQEQLTAFVNQSANNIQAPFPVGLSTDVGILVANPAYGGAPVYAANWTTNAYHGTVVWSWQLAMLAAGLQRQLERCSTSAAPDFCDDSSVYDNVLAAYNHLWDLIEANECHLSSEVWSWQYRNGNFDFIELGELPPPAGVNPTESNIRQLWSLTFLAVTRDESLR
jgi:glycogen debranching enzyme